MIPGINPVVQSLLGTFVTWGLTALGSALVFLLDVKDVSRSQKILDTLLGFAAGVMLAASYWSLLAPAIEIAEESLMYGPNGRWSFVPASVGFAMGALGMVFADSVLPDIEILSRPADLDKKIDDPYECPPPRNKVEGNIGLRKRKNSAAESDPSVAAPTPNAVDVDRQNSWRRVVLLVFAITLHNFPEGMAVGVGFGSIGSSSGSSFANAVNLAIGIGLQNFPEGLAVSMPLRREGMSPMKSFMWGQLSGMVEPIGGMLGAWAVLWIQPILPYALSFAAGAMVYVVVDDLIPEACQSGNRKLSSIGTIIGFIVMMTMDVALG